MNREKLGDIKIWERKLTRCRIVYGICIALLGLAILTFLFPNALYCAGWPGWLDRLVAQKAISAVIGAVGFSAIVIAWLVGAIGKPIYGVTTGVLVDWAYPSFFRFYFFIFLSSILAGLYIGNVTSRRLPLVFLLLSVAIGTAFLARVCYIFVFSFEKQKRIGYTYHYEQIAAGHTSRTLLLLATVTHNLELAGEEINAGALADLWCATLPQAKIGPQITGLSFLAQRFWNILFAKGLSLHQRITVTEKILNQQSYKKDGIKILLFGLLLHINRQENSGAQGNEYTYELLKGLLCYDQLNGTGKENLRLLVLLYGYMTTVKIILKQLIKDDIEPVRELIYAAGYKLETLPEDEINRYLEELEEIYLSELGCAGKIYSKFGSEAKAFPEHCMDYIFSNLAFTEASSRNRYDLLCTFVKELK